MNSFKNSEQARKMREWRGELISKEQNDREIQAIIERENFFHSRSYLAARQKALKDRIHAYLIVGCAICVIGVLMFWP